MRQTMLQISQMPVSLQAAHALQSFEPCLGWNFEQVAFLRMYYKSFVALV